MKCSFFILNIKIYMDSITKVYPGEQNILNTQEPLLTYTILHKFPKIEVQMGMNQK